MRSKPWYYGPLSREDCDKLMSERGQDGDFLVRDSESNVSNVKKIDLLGNKNGFLNGFLVMLAS